MPDAPDATTDTGATDSAVTTAADTTADTTTTAPAATDTTTAATTDTTAATDQATDAQNLDDLPEWARKAITKANNEAARHRTGANDKAQKAADKAAADATAKVYQKLGVDLGLIKADEAADPNTVIAALTEERDTNAKELREYKRADAIRAGAKKHSADTDALLDSAKFLRGLDALDTTSSDYAAQVAEAISEAVEANPKFKGAPAVPSRSGSDTSKGTTETAGQLTREQFAALTNEQRLEAVKAGRAKTLLGRK